MISANTCVIVSRGISDVLNHDEHRVRFREDIRDGHGDRGGYYIRRGHHVHWDDDDVRRRQTERRRSGREWDEYEYSGDEADEDDEYEDALTGMG